MIKKTSNALLGTFTASSLILLLNFFTGIFLARFLQPDGRGALAAVLFWPHLIAGIGILSLNEAATYRTSKSGTDTSKVISSGFWLALCLSFITILIGILLLPYLLGPERKELLSLSQIYILIYLPFNFIYLILFSSDLGQLLFKRYNLIRLIQPMVYIVGLISIWIMDNVTVEKVVYVVLLSTVLSAIIKIMQDNRKIMIKPSWNEVKKLLSTGFSFHTTNLLTFANTEMDRLIIITLLDNTNVGIYAVAITIASVGQGMISHTFRTVLFPYISKSVNDIEQRTLIAESLRCVMLLLVVTTILLISICPWMIPFLFGKVFIHSVTPAIILLVAFVPKALKNVMIYNLRSLGKAQPGTNAEIVALLVFSICALPLINSFELIGAAVALMVSNIISLMYLSVYLYKNLDLSPFQWWGLNATTLRKIIYAGRSILNAP